MHFLRNTTVLAIAACAALPCYSQASEAASPALVNHLLSMLEAREKAGSTLSLATLSISSYIDAEEQLRRLGSRASAAAPRVAELLTKSQKHASQLSWTLWAVAPAFSAVNAEELWASVDNSPLPQRLLTLAQLGHDPSRSGLDRMLAASAWPEREARSLAAIALSQRRAKDQVETAVQQLALMLKDSEKEVRQSALNGLRLQGSASAAVAPAVIEHLRGRENVWMSTQVLEHAALRDLQPLRAELESILADSKLSSMQKEPTVRLLMRLETETSSPMPVVPRPVAVRPVPPPDASPTRK